MVNTDFLKGQPFPTSNLTRLAAVSYMELPVPYPELRNVQSVFSSNAAYANSSLVQKLTNEECITAYGTEFVHGHGHVLLITNQEERNKSDTLVLAAKAEEVLAGENNYHWICAGMDMPITCDIGALTRNSSSWAIRDIPIEYCLSQVEESHCRLEVSTPILTVVIIMNACKTACMLWTLWKQRAPTLVTIGDAITSFLDDPDELTTGRCLMGRADVDDGPLTWRAYNDLNKQPILRILPQTYHSSPHHSRWWNAASPRRWYCTSIFIITTLAIAGGLLGSARSSINYSMPKKSIFSLGFGKVDLRALISSGAIPQNGSSGLMSAVLVANIPQAICSFLYLACEYLLWGLRPALIRSSTIRQRHLRFHGARLRMEHLLLVKQEALESHNTAWYGKLQNMHKMGPLQMHEIIGQQRSTYYLQLPYVYSVPLTIASGTLHWLISESIFLVRIDTWRDGKEIPGKSSSQYAYFCQRSIHSADDHRLGSLVCRPLWSCS